MDRIKSNKDILFVHKQDAIRMASRFKRTINSLLDGQKDRFGEECDFQLREKCKSPNSSTTSGLHGRSVVMYNSTYTAGGNSSTKVAFDSKKYSTIGDFKRHERSCQSAAPTISASRYSSVEKEEQDNRYSTTSDRSFEELERKVQESEKVQELKEEPYNPLQVDSVVNIQPGNKPQFKKQEELYHEGPLSSPFELTMNQSNDGRNESLEAAGAHQIMSYQELEELRGSTARNKLLRSGSQYSFKTPTFEHQFRAQSSANSRGLSGSSYQFNRRQNSRKDGWQSLGNTLNRAQSAQLREPIQEEVSHRSPNLIREIDFLKSNERMLRQSLEAMTLEFHGKQRLNEELEEELNMKDERIVDLESKLARANRKKMELEGESKRKVEELRRKLKVAENNKNSLQEEIERLNGKLRGKREQRIDLESGDEESKNLKREISLLMEEVHKWSREYEKCKTEKQEKERKLSEFTFLVENKNIELTRLHQVHQLKEMQFRESKIKLDAELRITREHVSDLKTKLDVAQQQIQIKENECLSKELIILDVLRKLEVQEANLEQERKEQAEQLNLVKQLETELKTAHAFQKEVETRFKQAAKLVQSQCEAQVRNEYEKIDSIKGAIIQEVQNYEVEIEKLKREKETKEKELINLKNVEPTSNDSLIRAELELSYNQKLAESEKLIKQLQQENQSLRSEQECLKSSVEDVKRQSCRFQEEIGQWKAESQKLRDKLNKKKQKLKGERESHQAQKENLSSNLKNVLEVTQKERVQSHLKQLDESKYLKEIERLKMNEISLQKQIKGMGDELNQLNSKYSSTTSQCKELLEQMSTLKESKQELERSVSHYSTSMRCTRNELSRQEENEGYLLDTIAKYKAEVIEKEERIVQMEGMLKSQRALSQEMKSMLNKQKMLSQMKQEKEEKMQQKVEDLTSKRQTLESALGQKSRENHKLKIQIEQLEIGYSHLKEKLVEENQKNNDLEQENETLKEQVTHLQEHVESLVELNSKNKDLREEKSVLMGELESKNQQCLHQYFELFAEGKIDSILDLKSEEEDDINQRGSNMIPTKEY